MLMFMLMLMLMSKCEPALILMTSLLENVDITKRNLTLIAFFFCIVLFFLLKREGKGIPVPS